MTKRILLISISIAIAVTSIGYALLRLASQPTKIAEVTNNPALPITGTFYMGDTNATPAQLRLMIKEMAETGMDTIIILATGHLDKKNGAFTELIYFNDPKNTAKDVMRYANEFGMDIYIGLSSFSEAINPWLVQNHTDINTDLGRLIDFSFRLTDSINAAAIAENIPLNKIKGYYLGETGPANLLSDRELAYWKYLTQKIKAKSPNKKIIISPYVLQENSYSYIKSVYEHVYSQTLIDIIAPQDSMGSLKVTTTSKSSELFRGLHDATAAFPGREAWANIETQLQPSVTDGNYNPSNINMVSSQIAAAQPYVSKTITWIYQHTMLSDLTFDNIYSWTGQYTPSRAGARRQLRTDYLSKYAAPITMYYYDSIDRVCYTTESKYIEPNLCQSNLATYRPGRTTGNCYKSEELCKNANPTTQIIIPGDLNADNHVNSKDYAIFITGFQSKKYTIFDYVSLVANYGK